MADHLTVGDVSRLFGVEDWQVRRTVDRLDAQIPRAGNYRLIPRHLLGEIAAGLRDRGWLPSSSPQQPRAQGECA